MKKRQILSLVLSIIFVLGMMTQVAVFAEGETKTVTNVLIDENIGVQKALDAGLLKFNNMSGSVTVDAATDAATVNNDARFMVKATLVPGRKYTYTAYIKQVNETDTGVQVKFTTASKVAVDGKDAGYPQWNYGVSTEWKKIECTFTYTGTSTRTAQYDMMLINRYAAKPIMIKNPGLIESYEVPVEAFSGDVLDISCTANTTVEPGKSIHLAVNGKDAFGLTGLTYETSNDKVATVKDGVVTGVASGVAVITAKAGDKSDSIMVMVGSGIAAKTYGDFTDKTGAVLDKTLDRSGDGTGAVKFDGTTDIKTLTSASGNCLSFWYYDADTSKTSNDFFQMQGYKTDKRINFWFMPFASKPLFQDCDGGLVTKDGNKNYYITSPARSVGWHQLVLITADDFVKLYIDCEEIFNMPRNPEANVNPGLNFIGSIKADTIPFWLDDSTILTIDASAEAPEEEEPDEPDEPVDITENVIDAYITKDAVVNTIASYDFSSNPGFTGSVGKWDSENGIYTVTHTNTTKDRITTPAYSWKKGAKYTFSMKLKGTVVDSRLNPFLASGSTVYTDVRPEGGTYYQLRGSCKIPADWATYTYEMFINKIADKNGVELDALSSQIQMVMDKPAAGDTWSMDDMVITETISGYKKLGLKAEYESLIPGEKCDLTVVGNNGFASYKVMPENVTLSSSDDTVISVNSVGVLTAHKLGQATITATDGELSATLTLDVTEPPVVPNEFHVATNGNDTTGTGTADAPFATIERARDEIRSLYRLPEGGATVYVHGGEYVVTKAIEFTEKDSGTKESPITYKAYNGEKVSLIGGKALDVSKIQKVTDSALLDRLIEEDAKDHLYMLDLGAQGIEMDDIQPWGWNLSGYKPMRIYMNDVLLDNARWPNRDQSQLLTVCRPLTKADGIDEDKYNTANTPIIFEYSDPENRSKNWTINKDSYVGGSVAHFWASTQLLLDNVDTEKKILTSKTPSVYASVKGVGWGPEHKLYFGNIFEEIDVPGESWVDRDKEILYFYPVGDLKGEMVVSTLRENIIKATNADYIKFSGIDFKDSIELAVSMTGCDNVVIEDAEVANISRAGIFMKNCTNALITGCHFYNIGTTPVEFEGGDRNNLVSTGNILENSLFHNTSILTYDRFSRCAVVCDRSVGEIIRHNEFNDLDYGALDLNDANDVVFEYNKVSYAEQNSTDAGVVYWGRDIATFGNVVRYNYFENIGSYLISIILESGGACSIFVDDASTAGNYYGNVFYNGGAERGGVTANGGEFGNVWGNVSIDTVPSRSNTSFMHRVWGYLDGLNEKHGVDTSKLNNKTAIGSYIYLNNFRDKFGSGNSGSSGQELIWSDAWKEHYKGTQWEAAINQYSKERYDSVKALYDAGKYKEIIEFLSEDLPNELTTNIHDNVSLGELRMTSRANHYNNYNGTQDKITDEDKALFVDFDNKDFTLTAEGLAKIQAVSPEFKAIPFKEIGLLTEVGGHAPKAAIKPEIFTGVAASGNTITAAYEFSDEDGDAEGLTKVYWYSADKPTAEFKLILGAEGKDFKIPDELAGKYIKYEVAPYDVTIRRGENVMSDMISVRAGSSVDFSALSAVIAEAKKLADEAVVGTETGTYPAESIATLREAIVAAQAVANAETVFQYEVNDAVKALEAAIGKFKITENLTLEFVGIKDILTDKNNWLNEKGEAINPDESKYFDGAKLVLTEGETIRYTGKKYGNEILNFKVRFEPIVQPDGELPAINSDDGESKYSINGGSIKIRGQVTSGEIWDTKTDFGLLLWHKNKTTELQEYKPGQALSSFTNDVFTEYNKDYIVSYGAYDVGEGTKICLYVDGKLVAERECISDANVGLEGYVSFRGPNVGTRMIVSAAESETSALEAKIAEVEAILAGAEAGADYGQYSADVIAELEAVVAEAKELSSDDAQLVIDRMVLSLDNAAKDFEVAANDTSANASGEYDINYNLDKAEFNVADNKAIVIKLDKEELTPAISTSTATANGTIKMDILRGTALEGANWNGELKSPAKTETPSASIGSGIIVSGVYNVADTAVVADRLVRIVLPGEGSKRVYYKNESGKYVEIKARAAEDSEAAANAAIKEVPGAAKIKVGNDLVVYTNFLTELVTFAAGSTSDDSDDDYTSGSQSGGSSASNAGGNSASSGFFVSDTITAALNVSNSFVFEDMKEHWAKNDVMKMYNTGIVSGVTANTFEPDRNITRAEFATLIVKALNLAPEKSADFSDVKDEWFAPYVGAAAKAGIIVGADGAFRPNDTITRQEMAVIIMKAYALLGKTAGTGAIGNFADKADIAVWALPYVDGAATAGIISGMGDGSFAPSANATRAQAASVVSRIL